METYFENLLSVSGGCLYNVLSLIVRFTGVKDFEYTPECIIFDLLSIGLYHGWLVDPQLEDLTLAINSKSYNQVVESIITGRTSDDPIEVSKSLLAEQFLEESASQLTYHGCVTSNRTCLTSFV